MLVDAQTQEVFVSSASSSSVTVLSFSGQIEQTIPDVAGAGGMALIGSNLYVVASNAGAVEVISTSTLQKSTLATGIVAAEGIVVAGGLLWVTDDGLLASVSPSTGTVTASTVPGDYELVADPADTNTFFGTDPGISPGAADRFVVAADGTVTLAIEVRFGSLEISNIGDLAVSPDGAHVVPAGGSPYQFYEFNSSNFSPTGVVYPSDDSVYPTAAAMTSANGGLFAGGMNGIYSTDVVVYPLDDPGTLMLSYYFGQSWETTLPQGLAFSPDGSELFDVTGGPPPASGVGPDEFHVFSIPTKSSVTLSLPAAQAGTAGAPADLQLSGSDSVSGVSIVTWQATGLPTGLTLSSSTGLITGTPNAVGSFNPVVTATDSLGSSSSESFPWDITSPVAVVNPGMQLDTSGAGASLSIVARDALPSATVTSFSATGLPPGLSIASATGVISGKPDTSGMSIVTVTATDSAGYSGSATFTWKIVNDVSVLQPGPQTSVTGAQLTLDLVSDDSSSTATVSWSASGLPPGLTIGPSTGVVTGTATTAGSYLALITATDSAGFAGSVYVSWTLWNEVTVSSPGTTASIVGTPDKLQLRAEDSSATAAITSWSVAGLPPGLAVTPGTGLISGTPVTAGTFGVTATATDSAGYTASTFFEWSVSPFSVPGPRSVSSWIGHPVTVTVAAHDATTNAALRYSATGLPAGLSISTTTGVISGRPTNAAAAVVVVTVTDSKYSQDVRIAWTVSEPISVFQQPRVRSAVDKGVSIQVRATERAAGALRYKAAGLPNGVVMSPVTGKISGVPRSRGFYTARITVSDGYTSRFMSFGWTVR